MCWAGPSYAVTKPVGGTPMEGLLGPPISPTLHRALVVVVDVDDWPTEGRPMLVHKLLFTATAQVVSRLERL
jgi:hypothetical protein